MGVEIAIAARMHDRKGVTAPRGLDLHFLDRLLQRLGVVNRADIDVREVAERISVERRDRRVELNRADAVLLAFLDLEGHQEALAFRVVFGQRRHHLHVGIAVLEIKAANQIPIGLDPVRIIDVGAAEEAQEIRFARLDDVAQAIRRISNVADEFDRLDAGFPTLDDGENQIDAVVGLLDDFRRHAYVVAA